MDNPRRRLKVLLSAYACEPNRGSEPGVGWNTACEVAQYHDVWVLTSTRNRRAIEAADPDSRPAGLHFAYHDPWSLPDTVNFDEDKLAIELHYYVWQLSAYFRARQLHREIEFDLVNHVTYVRYWMPSLMSWLGVPCVLGPVGGGETAPSTFWDDIGGRARRFEQLRDAVRWLGEHDPLVRRSIQGSQIALATTGQTADRLRHLNAPKVRVLGECGLRRSEVDHLGALSPPPDGPIRFLSIGRLLHWKGFHLGLRAFARAGISDARYWIVGDGPWRDRLKHEAGELGITEQVCFFGQLPRVQAMEKLGGSHVIVHPSLHDSGGWVCLEAMAARRPVICLDTGGPSYQVTSETGIKVDVHSPDQVVADMSEAMRALAKDSARRRQIGDSGHQRVLDTFLWSHKTEALLNVYDSVTRPVEEPVHVL